MPTNVSELRADQISEASNLLARAFRDDPLASCMFPDATSREKFLVYHFGAIVKYGHLAEKVWTVGDLDGVMVCQPPGHIQLDPKLSEESGLDGLGGLIGEEALGRFRRVTSYAEQFRKRDAGGDHWYVMVVGVDPAKSGRGLGSRLLARMFEEAERDKTPCYLETAQPRNVPFYKKNGFDLLLEDVDPVNKVRFWTFRRDPGTGRRKD